MAALRRGLIRRIDAGCGRCYSPLTVNTSPQGGSMTRQQQRRSSRLNRQQSTVTHSDAVGGGAFLCPCREGGAR